MRRPARELRQDRSSGIPCSANPNNRLSRCAFPRSCVTTWSAPEKYSPATTRSPYPRRRFANCCWNLPSTTTWTIAWKWPIYGCAPRGLADHPAQMEAAPGSVARGMDLSGPMRTDRLRGAGPGPGTAAPGILRAGAGGLPGGAPLAPGGQGGVGPLLLGKSGVAGCASPPAGSARWRYGAADRGRARAPTAGVPCTPEAGIRRPYSPCGVARGEGGRHCVSQSVPLPYLPVLYRSAARS